MTTQNKKQKFNIFKKMSKKNSQTIHINIYLMTLILSIIILLPSLFISSSGYKSDLFGQSGLFHTYFENKKLLLYNLIPIYFIILSITFVLKSLPIGFLISSIIINIGSYVNYIKIVYREEPLLASDLILSGEAFNMAQKYDLNFNSINFKWLLMSIITSIIISIILSQKCKIYYNKNLKQFAISIICLIVFITQFVFNDKTYATLGKESGLNKWVGIESYQSKGFTYPFLYSIKSAKTYKYDKFNKKEAMEIYSSYTNSPIPEDKKINIMGIMLESFKDFSVYQGEDLIFIKDPYQYFHNLQENSLHGNLIVNSFGGGTFLTETNFLTGYRHNPKFNKKTMSYVNYLNENGYSSYAFHPNTGTFYNRNNAYKNLGFEKFYEYDNTFYQFDENLLMDSPFYDFIIGKFDELPKNMPKFFWSVTYQNHGPYSTSDLCDANTYIAWNDNYSKEWYNYFNHYLDGISNTSYTMEKMVDYLKSINEPTILIMFGDHSPSMGENNILFKMFDINNDKSSSEGIYNTYSTPYIVWGNDAAKNLIGKDFKGQIRDLEPAFLMSEIFKYIGWEGNQYNQFLTNTTERFSILKEHWMCVDGKYMDLNNFEDNDYDNNIKTEIHKFLNMEYYTSHLLD